MSIVAILLILYYNKYEHYKSTYNKYLSGGIALDKVQQAAFDLIREDTRFLYAITDIMRNAKNIDSNYICMSLPYIGLFADGAEQWCKKIRLNAPRFNQTEKIYYTQLRQSHKLFEKSYVEYRKALLGKLTESDYYFYSIRRLREKILGYYNVGTDLCCGEYCGNTILCSMYIPIKTLGNDGAGPRIKSISIIVGKLAAYFGCTNLPVYKYNDSLTVSYKDYHLYKNSPLKMNNDTGFLLFSILCSINYAIKFIENYFIDEIPQKFKYAYLQYYYLCNFINDLNSNLGTKYRLDNHLYDRQFRNCIAHYGLGQYITESEIYDTDILKGLTIKAFKKDYLTTKNELYIMLKSLAEQIKADVLV